MYRDKGNKLLTTALFLEYSRNPEFVLYTLNRQEVDGYPSLYQLYMAEEDFTEFTFAEKYFESYQHWKRICSTTWFTQYIADWREELELKVKSRSLKSLINKAESDSNVAKYLLNNKWVEQAQEKNPVTNLRGRPSKEEIKSHLTLIVNEEKEIEKDYERIKGLA